MAIHTKAKILILVSAIIRAVVAGFIELGNDEVYYWTYAMFPDLSHFDHPPMVGFIIQLFSLDLLLDSEFFIRLGAVLFGSINTWLIYRLGRKIFNDITGYYAAWLFTSSIYFSVIAGLFILPDTPQILFWLLALNIIFPVLINKEITKKEKLYLMYAGIVIGLGMLSKYTTVFIWLGLVSYILIYDRRWLKVKELYFSVLLSILIFLPVVFWNIDDGVFYSRCHFRRLAGRFFNGWPNR